MATLTRISVLLALVFGCDGCATSLQSRAPELDYAGTISYTCGSTDGAASIMHLRARNSEHDFLRVYLDGLGPTELRGVIQTSSKSIFPRVTINSCSSEDPSLCTIETNPTTDGSVTVSNHIHGRLEGMLHFKRADGRWGDASFKANIVPPSEHMRCG